MISTLITKVSKSQQCPYFADGPAGSDVPTSAEMFGPNTAHVHRPAI
jgi:hypothetical protein